jgi:hypothetical protein
MTTATQLGMASGSKTFTALVVLKLVEQRRSRHDPLIGVTATVIGNNGLGTRSMVDALGLPP